MRKIPSTNKSRGNEPAPVIDPDQSNDPEKGLFSISLVAGFSGVSDSSDNNHTLGSHSETISAVQLPQRLTAAIDAWAVAHQIHRSDAIRELIELGLKAAPSSASHQVQRDSLAIEDEAIALIRGMLDPSLPPDERERRIRRLVDGPPEFSEERIDLPKHGK